MRKISATTSPLFENWFFDLTLFVLLCIAVKYLVTYVLTLRYFCVVYILLLTFAFCIFCAGDAQYCQLSAVAFLPSSNWHFLLVWQIIILQSAPKMWASQLTCMDFHLEWGCNLQCFFGWYSPLMHLYNSLPEARDPSKVLTHCLQIDSQLKIAH